MYCIIDIYRCKQIKCNKINTQMYILYIFFSLKEDFMEARYPKIGLKTMVLPVAVSCLELSSSIFSVVGHTKMDVPVVYL